MVTNEWQYQSEIKALTAEMKKLDNALATSRQAETQLDIQKQENLQLKETIDRLRFDLDEAKSAATNSINGKRLGKLNTASSNSMGTLSKSLGDEISRRLAEVQEAGNDDDGVIETVITTQRTRVSFISLAHSPNKTLKTDSKQKIGARHLRFTPGQSQTADPVVRVEEGVREYADIAVNTESWLDTKSSAEAGPSHDHAGLPPAYTPKPDPLTTQEILAQTHPREAHHIPTDVEEEYEALVEGLGIRCNIIEEQLKVQKVTASRESPAHNSHPGTRGSRRARVINYIFLNNQDTVAQSISKAGAWTVAVFASEFI
jgi:hypothetical protein